MIYSVCKVICMCQRSFLSPHFPHRRAQFLLLTITLSPNIALMDWLTLQHPVLTLPTEKSRGWEERHFHFCVITKTAIGITERKIHKGESESGKENFSQASIIVDGGLEKEKNYRIEFKIFNKWDFRREEIKFSLVTCKVISERRRNQNKS